MFHRPVNLLKPQKTGLPPPPPPQKKSRALGTLYFFIFVIIVITLNWGIKQVTAKFWLSDENSTGQVTLQPKNLGILQIVKNFIFPDSNVLAADSAGRTNILLLGMGGVGHDGPYLTDTNIILSIKPDTAEAALISIPRDLRVNLPGYGAQKINAANAEGEAASPGAGGEYARTIFANTFNLPIPYYIRVDFKAFEEIIDAVGGINITVPRGFTDTLFPLGETTGYQTVSFVAGPQVMNGERALTYARSRHGNNGEGSDFARSARQQLVLNALKDKVFSLGTLLNPVAAQRVFASLSDHITTNLNFGQIIYLLGLARSLNGITRRLVLDNSPNGFLVSYMGESGAYLLSPKTGSFDAINYAIAHIFDATTTAIAANYAPPTSSPTFPNQPVYSKPASFLPAAQLEIQNGTWQAGLAARVRSRLEARGYSIITVSNSSVRPIATTTIYILSDAAPVETVTALARELNATSTATLPFWVKAEYAKLANEAQILVVLGTDYKE